MSALLLLSNIKKYFQIVLWMYRWCIRFHLYRVILMLVFGGVGIVAQGAIIGLLLTGVNNIGSKLIIPYIDVSVGLTTTSELISFGSLIVVMLAVVAVLDRQYQLIINSLSVRFERSIIAGTLKGLEKKLVDDSKFSKQFAVTGGARVTGKALRILLQSVIKLIQVVVFTVICFYLAPLLSLLIIVALVPFYLAHAKLNIIIHRNEIALEQVQRKSSNTLRAAVNSNKVSCVRALDNPEVSESIGRYHKRINSTVSADLISSIGMAIALGGSLGWFLYAYSIGRVEVGSIIAYLFAIRLLATSGVGLSVGFAAFTRLYSKVERTHGFFRGSVVLINE